MKHKQVSCLDLGSIPKISHYEYANIKNWDPGNKQIRATQPAQIC